MIRDDLRPMERAVGVRCEEDVAGAIAAFWGWVQKADVEARKPLAAAAIVILIIE